MIERVYIDNYRVFVNCEIKLQSVALLLGPNGGGKSLSRQIDVLNELRKAIDGFDSLKLDGPADATATLRATFRPAGAKSPLSFKFGELSDGQRQLVLLYTVLLGVADGRRILLLDEPDNFVALREIEPWLTMLMDAAGQTLAQAVVISHHPEVIDHLAREKGIWFAREDAGPARIATGKANDTAPLKPSEVEARGW